MLRNKLSSVIRSTKTSSLLNLSRSFSTFDVDYEDNRVCHKYLSKERKVSIIGIPLSYGQPKSGVEHGPAVLRANGLIERIENEGWVCEDEGDVFVPVDQKAVNEHISPQEDHFKLKCADLIGDVTHRTCDRVAELAKKDNFILTLGGDHSIAIGTVAGILKARPETAVVWVDAHADINTPLTSGSGNIHGMPVSLLMKHEENYPLNFFQWLEEVPDLLAHRIVYIGLRDVDKGERRIIKQKGIKAFTMMDVDRYGIGKVMELAIEHVRNGVDRPIHLSFDIDGVDPAFAPATGTTVRGGLTYREAFYICESLSETGLLSSMDLVEVNPDLAQDANEFQATVNMSVRLAAAALGNRLL